MWITHYYAMKWGPSECDILIASLTALYRRYPNLRVTLAWNFDSLFHAKDLMPVVTQWLADRFAPLTTAPGISDMVLVVKDVGFRMITTG